MPDTEDKDQQKQFRKLMTHAGINEALHTSVIKGLSDFTDMLAAIIEANPRDAPNFITFETEVSEDQRYELTIRKCAGITPSEVITDLRTQLAFAEAKILDLELGN